MEDAPGSDAEAFYDEFWTDGIWSGTELNADEQARLAAISQCLERFEIDGRALDVGCGRGVITRRLPLSGPVIGIDPVQAAIAAGRDLFPDLDLRHATADQFSGADFDVVVSTEVIEHVPTSDQASFVADLHAALRPGGHAVITTPRGTLREAWLRHADSDQPLENWLTEAALDALLTRAGFEVLHRSRAVVYPITQWRVPLVISPVRRLAAKVPPLRRLIDRAGIYQVVVAHRVS